MKPIFSRMVAAIALGSAMLAAVPAEARRDRWDHRGDYGRHWDGDRGWRGDRYRGGYRGYDGYRGDYGRRGYYGRGYYAPRYGYGYGYPRGYGYRHRDGGDDALIGALAGIAIGAAIASD